MSLKPYRKNNPLSYTLGAYPTVELLRHAPQSVHKVYTHPKIDLPLLKMLKDLVVPLDIPLIESDAIDRLSGKRNVFVAATFQKSQQALRTNRSHLVLVNPSNYGNLGTIFRSSLGWDYWDIALIEPAADPFHPSCVRASMGAHFQLRIHLFHDIDGYRKEFPDHQLWSLMTRKTRRFESVENFGELHSLILGNESSGLPERYVDFSTPLTIDTNHAIDSLNITLAAAIAMHHVFSKKGPIRG